MNPTQNPNLAPQGPELPAPVEQGLPLQQGEAVNKPLEAPARPAERVNPAPAERKASTVDRQPAPQAPANQNSPQQAQQVPLQAPVTQAQPTISQAAQDNNPVIADDVDVIEKEWVSKAKEVVKSTSNDPYQQEKEVSKLQADYLKKRYGKDIKIPQE